MGPGARVVQGKSGKEGMTAAVESMIQLVTFRIGGEEYGLNIRSVTEVVRQLKTTTLPQMPEFVEGVINLRGAIIPVVDMRKRFALSRTADNPKKIRILITKGAFPGAADAGRDLLGLVVDSAQEVLHVPQKDIDPAPEAATGAHVGFLAGMAKVNDRLIILLDITKVLSRQERSALAESGGEEDEKTEP
jgi:purine-binding chemotaxis protein CheW